MSDIDAVALSNEIMFVLQERVRNNADSLPAGQLLAYGRDLAKLELARIAAKPPEKEKVELTTTDILSIEGLPTERKRLLLHDQREKASTELQLIDEALSRLDQEGT